MKLEIIIFSCIVSTMMKVKEFGYSSLIVTIFFIVPLGLIAYDNDASPQAWIVLAIFAILVFAFSYTILCSQKSHEDYNKAMDQLDESRNKFYATWREYEKLLKLKT